MNRRAIQITVIAFVLGVLIDVVLDYSPFPGYGASIGLFGCAVIVIVSKWLGQVFLDRPENYYPGEVPPDLQPDLLPPEHPDHQPHLRRGRR